MKRGFLVVDWWAQKTRAMRASIVSLAVALVMIGLSFGFGGIRVAMAACDPNIQSCSSNYGVSETYFGSGGDLNDCSTNYCAKTSVGELGVGNSKSTNYQAQAGFNTDRAPSLSFMVGGGADLGVLSVGSTATATATFSVKSYLAGGYAVTTMSDPPKTEWPVAHTFNALTTPTAASTGVEQFGINVVANTSPKTFGAAPLQYPDSTFSYGIAASGYNTANLFKYVKGDTIARSNSSSGETDYTISYIYNISNVTVAGTYQFNQVLVATSTF